MSKRTSPSTRPIDEAARQRRLDMQHLQVIEGNPLTADRECETKSPAGEVPQMSAAEQARLSAAGSPEGARDAGRRKGRKPSGAGC